MIIENPKIRWFQTLDGRRILQVAVKTYRTEESETADSEIWIDVPVVEEC